jgi:hypothetical protein
MASSCQWAVVSSQQSVEPVVFVFFEYRNPFVLSFAVTDCGLLTTACFLSFSLCFPMIEGLATDDVSN